MEINSYNRRFTILFIHVHFSNTPKIKQWNENNISILPLSMGFLLDFRTVPTMWNYFFLFFTWYPTTLWSAISLSLILAHKKKKHKSTLVLTSSCLPSKIDNLSFIKKKVKYIHSENSSVIPNICPEITLWWWFVKSHNSHRTNGCHW